MYQALTIAGSDSGGGAGIQADLKTFQAHGVYGTSIITSVTAQNTQEIRTTHTVPADVVAAQLLAILDDFDIRAAKTGMLPSTEIIDTVAVILQERKCTNLIVDPVMIASSGHALTNLESDDAIRALKRTLFPLALLVTPNINEAERLAEMKIDSPESMQYAAKRIHEYGSKYVLIKGGHARFDPATDILYDGTTFEKFSAPYIKTKHTHGTGCVYSAAITAHVATGKAIPDAVRLAKQFITHAIEHSLHIGKGSGPVNPFFGSLDNKTH